MRLFLSRLLVGAVVPLALILPLTALQLMQRTPLPVQRFREPTLTIYGILLLALVIAPRRRQRLRGAVAWTRSVLGHPGLESLLPQDELQWEADERVIVDDEDARRVTHAACPDADRLTARITTSVTSSCGGVLAQCRNSSSSTCCLMLWA